MRIVGFCLKLVGGLALAALVALFFGWFVQHLWNWLMPALFKLPVVTFWQAAGLVLLARIFVGHGGGHKGGHKWKPKWVGSCSRCGGRDKASAFAPGGDVHNWEHFDDWWKEGGEASFEAFVGEGNRGWGWWKWWKSQGRAEFERWMDDRKP